MVIVSNVNYYYFGKIDCFFETFNWSNYHQNYLQKKELTRGPAL